MGGTETLNELEIPFTKSTSQMEETISDESTNKKKQFCKKILFLFAFSQRRKLRKSGLLLGNP